MLPLLTCHASTDAISTLSIRVASLSLAASCSHASIFAPQGAHRTAQELIEEVRSVRRKLLFMAVGAALLAVPVALALFRAPPVNLMSQRKHFEVLRQDRKFEGVLDSRLTIARR